MKEVHAGAVTAGMTDSSSEEMLCCIRACKLGMQPCCISGSRMSKVAPSRLMMKTFSVPEDKFTSPRKPARKGRSGVVHEKMLPQVCAAPNRSCLSPISKMACQRRIATLLVEGLDLYFKTPSIKFRARFKCEQNVNPGKSTLKLPSGNANALYPSAGRVLLNEGRPRKPGSLAWGYEM